MARNIEIKARVSEAVLCEIDARACARSDREPVFVQQTDTFYNVPRGRLKLRRVRNGSAELISYDRSDEQGPKLSDYVLSPCVKPESLHAVLERNLGVRGTVEKTRRIVMVGQTRVHLDRVNGLGSFVELEVVLRDDQSPADGQVIADRLIAELGIGSDELIDVSYIDLVTMETPTAMSTMD